MDLEVEISHTKSANTCLICTCHRCRNIILIGGGGTDKATRWSRPDTFCKF